MEGSAGTIRVFYCWLKSLLIFLLLMISPTMPNLFLYLMPRKMQSRHVLAICVVVFSWESSMFCKKYKQDFLPFYTSPKLLPSCPVSQESIPNVCPCIILEKKKLMLSHNKSSWVYGLLKGHSGKSLAWLSDFFLIEDVFGKRWLYSVSHRLKPIPSYCQFESACLRKWV